MTRKAPAFQFYVDDWLGGTRHMSPAEKGCYIDLLASQWSHGWVPDDLNRLARICGCTPDEMTEYLPILRDKFEDKGDGRLVNPRLEHVRNLGHIRKQSGSKGGSKTAANNAANEAAKSKPPTPTPTPSPSSLPNPKNDVVRVVVLNLRKALRRKGIGPQYIDDKTPELWTLAWAGEQVKPGWLGSLTKEAFAKVDRPFAWMESIISKECTVQGTTLTVLRMNAAEMPKNFREATHATTDQ